MSHSIRLVIFMTVVYSILAGCNLVNSSGSSSSSVNSVSTSSSSSNSSSSSSSVSNPITMYSDVVQDYYYVFIDLPDGYATDTGTSYTTLYITDANWHFDPVRSWIHAQVLAGVMKPIILVAICPIEAYQNGYTGTSPSRCRDLIQAADPTGNFPGSGGAENFAAFIKNKLIPYIDSNYRTIPTPDNRCLGGHSLGGLFSLYNMFNHRDMFHKFLSLSPAAFPWDDTSISNMEATYAENNSDLNCTLFTSVSDNEWMIAYDPIWVNQIRNRNYPNFQLTQDILHGYDHDHSAVPGYQDALISMFPK